MYRIINKKKNIDEQNNQQAVYFQHGLFDSSDGWVCNYEKNCLPYILVNKGFDVVSTIINMISGLEILEVTNIPNLLNNSKMKTTIGLKMRRIGIIPFMRWESMICLLI